MASQVRSRPSSDRDKEVTRWPRARKAPCMARPIPPDAPINKTAVMTPKLMHVRVSSIHEVKGLRLRPAIPDRHSKNVMIARFKRFQPIPLRKAI